MSGKIAQLMEETARKARMDAELALAKAFQNSLFPKTPYQKNGFDVAGSYEPASECAGDWWTYQEVGDELVICVGDVTGHGAAAALVTALAQGTFLQAIKSERMRSQERLPLQKICGDLNSAIFESGTGALMSFVALTLNTRTREASLINAGHPAPQIYRRRANGTTERIHIASKGRMILGYQADVILVPVRLQFQPNDRILFFTDGLIESMGSSPGSRSRRLNEFGSLICETSLDSQSICKRIIGQATPHDDITVVLAKCPGL